MNEQVTASAPGSLMLLGEHAVLHGKQALVCAVNKRMHVTLRRRDDQTVHISSALGVEEQQRTDLSITDSKHTFVVAALRQQREKLTSGLDISINSEFDATLGLGSSAAVTAATTAALSQLCTLQIDPRALFDDALRAVRAVQGVGSGADLAASVFGSIVSYNASAPTLDAIPVTHPIAVVYSGAKTPTVEVIAHVESLRMKDRDAFDRLFEDMHACTMDAADAIRAGQWARVGELLDVGQEHMVALGVNNKALAEIIDYLRTCDDILGAKISGSGLGDCAIGLGTADCNALPYEQIDVQMSPTGVTIDE